MTTRSGTIAGDEGKAQHVDLWRKVKLRRELLTKATAGPAYVPFIGEGDIAVELYSNRLVLGCDLDPERVAVAAGRLAGDIRVADADTWPFADATLPFAVADFDAYSNPYLSLAAFMAGATKASRLVIFGTDGMRLGIKVSTNKTLGPLPKGGIVKADMPARRKQYNNWWTAIVLPYLTELVAPGRITDTLKYQRQHMLYWGVVVDYRASTIARVAKDELDDHPLVGQAVLDALDRKGGTEPTQTDVERVEAALLEAAVSGNVPAAIFWLEHKGGPGYRRPSPAEIAAELSRPLKP